MGVIGIADAVEVRTLTPQGETWLPATVVTIEENNVIGVAFSDGERLMVQSKDWRIPQ
jgi:hypothetical protein